MDVGKILRAIREAEEGSTGEIRVHLARRSWDPHPARRAGALFREQGMTRTTQRNAVLLYVNLLRRRFAFVYDEGLRGPVDENYWRGLARNLESDLRSTHYENAIVLAVRTLGATLKRHFPSALALAALLSLSVATGCGIGEKDAEADGTPPVVMNFGVTFDQYNAGTDLAGDFKFGQTLLGDGHTNKIFLEFGGTFRFGPEIGDETTAYYYLLSLPDGTEIVSPIDGRVQSIADNGSQDFAMHIQPTETSIWGITISHLKSVSVESDVAVTAGGAVGKANGSRGLELSLTNSDTGLSYCFFPYFDSGTLTDSENQIRNFMKDWETHRGDTALYDEKAMPHPGCLTIDSSGSS